ncbi:MAG TPA: YwiC-like family protein [Candidatus Angelobacter sp.]
MSDVILAQPGAARARALIVPREHGAWGLLLVPLFTGIAVGVSSAEAIPPLILLTVVSLALFCLRTPVESLLGTNVMRAQSSAERQAALIAFTVLAGIAAACLAGLFWNGRNQRLLLLGALAFVALFAQMLLNKLGRRTRMAAQLAGAVGLTCTAPAAYYVATGRLDERALILWAANWIFAAGQIHFVQLRIHSARAADFTGKFARGSSFFIFQTLLFAALVSLPILYLARHSANQIPAWTIIAFLPSLVRAMQWFFAGYQPLNVRSLGWSEMRQGILFGILLAIVFRIS